MKKLTLALAVMLVIGTSAIRAADTIKLPDTDIELGVARSGREAGIATLKFPLLEKKAGMIPVLKARFFYDQPTTGGGNYCGRLYMNVHKMSEKTYSGKARLLRLQPETKKGLLPDGKRALWYGMRRDQSGAWFIMRGPGTGELDKYILTTADGGWTYYFDISDLVKYTDTQSDVKENCLQLVCDYQAKKTLLKFRDMEILYMTEAEADARRKK